MCVVVTKITETRTCCAAAGESDSGGRPELRGANLHVQGGGYWSVTVVVTKKEVKLPGRTYCIPQTYRREEYYYEIKFKSLCNWT